MVHAKEIQKDYKTIKTIDIESLKRIRSISSSTNVSDIKHLPINPNEIKVLLLENINNSASEYFKKQGYQVDIYSKVMTEEELVEKIKHVHILGIQSKTNITKQILKHAENLVAIGCFCISSNQVDLPTATKLGVTIFNSSFNNARSVAELVIGEIIMLARQIADRNKEMHQGIWNKVSTRCFEIRGKTLGIVGYGHVGSQVSVLAEAMGMKVYFYDVQYKMSLGQARSVKTLDELLAISDYVSLHVPETQDTKGLIDKHKLSCMKKGSYLLNNACGSIVQIDALTNALHTGHLAGAAIDVFPKEPTANGSYFYEYPDFLNCKNLILTPHIGDSTEEAQQRIGIEVSRSLNKYIHDIISSKSS